MQGIDRENDSSQAKVTDHLLCGEYFIGRLINLGVREKNGRRRGEGHENLGRLAIVQMIETAAQHLAIQGNGRPPMLVRSRHQILGMAAEGGFERLGRQRLQHGPHRIQRRRPLQVGMEGLVEQGPPLPQKGQDAAIGPGTTQHREHAEQKQIRQGIALALGASGIGDVLQGGKQASKRNHGNPPLAGCSP